MEGLMTFLPLFELSGREFTPMAATWLHQERFMDDKTEIQKQVEAKKQAQEVVKPKEREVWEECESRCRFWDEKKRWCTKHETEEPKTCDHCRWFN
jgi:hypothetical protein